MRRAVAAVLSAVILGTSLSLTVGERGARADRPDSGQTEEPPPAPTPTPTPTAPPAPTPTIAPPTVIAPTVNAGSTIVINPPPTAATGPTGPTGATAPTYAPTGTVVTPAGVPIVIRNDVQAEHRLLSLDGMVLGSCMGNCTFQVPPGSYIVEMRETETYRSGRKKIVVTGPTMVDVSPGSKAKKTTGLVLGSVGAGLFLIGFFGTVFTAAANSSADFDCREFNECDEKSSVAPWVLALVAGAAGTTIGFVMFGTSGTKVNATAYAPSVSFAPMAWKDGGGAGLKIAF